MSDPSRLRVLVLGGTGMLGHKVWQAFRDRFETWVTVRDAEPHRATGLFSGPRVLTGVHAEDPDSLVRACAESRPTVIVNCVGIVKQRKAATDPVPSITLNALFPHRVAALGRALGARTIHISTDCVFSGARGNYSEHDTPDPHDLYGRTKLLGELSGPGCLTIRTSIIGRELSATTGLTEWLLSQRGRSVEGYAKAVFSGLTTLALSRVVGDIVERHPALEGLYHVASRPVSKYDLVRTLEQAYDAGIQIELSDTVQIDRSLDGTRFTQATGLSIPGWDEMIAEMAADSTPYEMWRSPGGAGSGG
jgi:dTDP-4-dehydrorhamnose reductase